MADSPLSTMTLIENECDVIVFYYKKRDLAADKMSLDECLIFVSFYL